MLPNIRSTRRREDCLLILPSAHRVPARHYSLANPENDPFSGNVLAAQRWDQLDPGARAVSVIYPLHTGELGGTLLMTVLGVGGLALFGLSVTGVWQWWRRRKARRVPSGTRNR
ncbi:hypothetical protein CUJ88_18030 [Paraburkholderia hospita]|nr:hypothetical protein CUJ88_18030 [Paraburkholderia hospita]